MERAAEFRSEYRNSDSFEAMSTPPTPFLIPQE
jgi:hypothetical protein